MTEVKEKLAAALIESKVGYPYSTAHDFNVDGELMVEITLDEFRSLVAENARLKAELSFLRGCAKNG